MRYIVFAFALLFLSCEKDKEILSTYDIQIYSHHSISSYEIYSAGKIVKKYNKPIGQSISVGTLRFFYSGSYESLGHDKDQIKIYTMESTSNLRVLVKGRTFNYKDFRYEDGAFIIEF